MGNDLDVWVQHFKNEGWELTQAGQDNAEFEKITRGPWVVAADDPAVVYHDSLAHHLGSRKSRAGSASLHPRQR